MSSSRLFEPTPNDLRALVLDYLCHNSYTGTARAFLKDSAVKHLDADGDEIMPQAEAVDALAATLESRLVAGELRKAVRLHILSGQVDEAIALLNQHFPSVLSENADEHSPGGLKGNQQYQPTTSVLPADVALNLRILGFIEAARSIPLHYYPPGAAVLSDTTSKDTHILRREGSSDEANVHLLHRAQSLYADANRLQDPALRSSYLEELGQVGGLLAYPVPEDGPLAAYMTQDRRDAMAAMVDSAILYRTGQRTISGIELCTRYTSNFWSFMHDLKVKPPPLSAWPAGASLPHSKRTPPKAAGNISQVTVKKSSSDGESAEPVPKFDLKIFLDSPA